MLRLLSRVWTFFQRRQEDPDEGQQRLLPELKHDRIQMEAVSDHFAHSGPSEPEKKILIGRVSSILDGTVYINKDTFFGLEDTVSEGFVPYKGDWVEVLYSIEPGASHITAYSVKPMNSRHVDEVSITSIHRRNGVIDNSIFFTLDSLKCPPGYVPRSYDIVSVVVVESSQACYLWRAISMTPVPRC